MRMRNKAERLIYDVLATSAAHLDQIKYKLTEFMQERVLLTHKCLPYILKMHLFTRSMRNNT